MNTSLIALIRAFGKYKKLEKYLEDAKLPPVTSRHWAVRKPPRIKFFKLKAVYLTLVCNPDENLELYYRICSYNRPEVPVSSYFTKKVEDKTLVYLKNSVGKEILQPYHNSHELAISL